MKIQITRDHIERGTIADPFHCPISLALRGVISWDYSICTNAQRVWVESDTKQHFADLDDHAQTFIAMFDTRIRVEPTEIELDIPEEFLRESKD